MGALSIFWPGIMVKGLLIIPGLWAIFQGMNLFIALYNENEDDPNRPLPIMTVLVLAIIGLVMIISPGVGVITISWLIIAPVFLIGALLMLLT